MVMVRTVKSRPKISQSEHPIWPKNCLPYKGPFIFYEVGGAGGIWGGAMQKKMAFEGGPSKKK